MIGHLGEHLPSETRDNPDIASVLSEGRTRQPRLFYRSYRAAPDEVGFAKVFDFSRATTGDRWREGAGDMQAALRALHESQNDREMGLDVHPILRAFGRLKPQFGEPPDPASIVATGWRAVTQRPRCLARLPRR